MRTRLGGFQFYKVEAADASQVRYIKHDHSISVLYTCVTKCAQSLACGRQPKKWETHVAHMTAPRSVGRKQAWSQLSLNPTDMTTKLN